MNIKEAKSTYSAQLNTLYEQQRKLKQAQNNHNFGSISNNAITNACDRYSSSLDNSGVIFEYSDKVQKSLDETQEFMEKLTIYSNLVYNAEVARQQGETMEKYTQDIAKCMETARRLASGAKVPAADEKKLMEFDMDIYMTAKNMGMLNSNKSDKEYDSLWDDDEENCEKSRPSASEVTDNWEVHMDLPETADYDLGDIGIE